MQTSKRANQNLAKNARAVCQFRSWLDAVQIPNSPSSTPGNDITVTAADGSALEIRVVAGEVPEHASNALTVTASVVTGRKIQKAIEAFHSVTEKAGYGTPEPVSRGPLPTKKLNYHDDFELVSMRHCEFRRVPNPDPEILEKYKPIIEMSVWSFFKLNEDMCLSHGLEISDLISYATVWTCNYLGLYNLSSSENFDNEKLLRDHLRQRFWNLWSLLKQKGKNIFVSFDDNALVTQEKAYEWNSSKNDAAVVEDSGPDLAYKARRCVLDTTSIDRRRTSASQLLDRLLGDLSEDKAISVLKDAVENRAINIDARKEASRKLQASYNVYFTLDANVCKIEDRISPSEGVVVEDDEVAGEDSDSDIE